MLVTQHPVFRRFWYPVMPLSLLEQGSPQPFELLGERIVLWLDKAGQPQAAADRCCHRSAQLSKGIVCDDHIRCPYHGWEFDGTGACVKVPQLPDQARIPESYRIPAYLCQARYGYAWVCLHPQPLRGIPVIPEAEDPSYRLIHEFYERWECASLRICENEFDAAHISFVHQNTFGSMEDLVPSHFEVEELDYGIRTRTVLGVANPELQQKKPGHCCRQNRAHHHFNLAFALHQPPSHPLPQWPQPCHRQHPHPHQRPSLPSGAVLFAQRHRSRYPSRRGYPL